MLYAYYVPCIQLNSSKYTTTTCSTTLLCTRTVLHVQQDAYCLLSKVM